MKIPSAKVTLIIIVILFVAELIYGFGHRTQSIVTPSKNERVWQIKSIDTMKYSRDLARQKFNDSSFDLVIDSQVKNIRALNANYIAVGTPYDEEFTPFLRRWVSAARKNNLHVWFRGNFSGWEGWFGRQKGSISREDHINLTKEFIKNNSDLFANGDIFSPCPECENGGPGDPRHETNVEDYRKFLIAERNASLEEFKKINKKIMVLDSMNFDVAKLVMDKDTTQAMGNVIVIDHYVKTPEKLSDDIGQLHELTGANIFLGEIGAPIPDITGNLSETEQANWLDIGLSLVSRQKYVIGINYWVAVGGSTSLFKDNLEPKQAADVLHKYFSLTRLD